MKGSYWKRGSKEDAERIKQAFFDAGCQAIFFKCDKEDTLYVYDGEIHKMGEIPYNSVLANAIMDSHMFCELELPEIEIPKPMFKVGHVIRWSNPETREIDWHVVTEIDIENGIYKTKTCKSKDYEFKQENEKFYELITTKQPKYYYDDLVVLDDLLGRITDSKYEDGMWLYRVGCRNTWNFDYELMKADHRDEHRILKGGGL